MDVNVARRRLEAEWERLLEAQIAVEQAHLSITGTANSSGELSPIDQQEADLGSDVVEREMQFSIRDRIDTDLQDLFDAFQRLDLGTYGRCETCSEPIPGARLAAAPATRFCVDHERLWELHAMATPFPASYVPDEARSAEDMAEQEAIHHLEFVPEDDEIDQQDELGAEAAALHGTEGGHRVELEAAEVEMADASRWEERAEESAAADLDERELRGHVRAVAREEAELGN
jgi:RNA polymerase-binding transcription factor DksA